MVSRSMVETAKEQVADIEIRDAVLERFTNTGALGFGFELKATKAGKEAFFGAIEQLGLLPEMNRRRATAQKGEFVYQVYVEVPDGWNEK